MISVVGVRLSPGQSMIFPPTVIITRSGSGFCGINLATNWAYVTVLPWGTCDFFMNPIVSVPVFILFPTPFYSRPNSFAILRFQTTFVVRYLIRSRYSIAAPVDGLITALHVCR